MAVSDLPAALAPHAGNVYDPMQVMERATRWLQETSPFFNATGAWGSMWGSGLTTTGRGNRVWVIGTRK